MNALTRKTAADSLDRSYFPGSAEYLSVTRHPLRDRVRAFCFGSVRPRFVAVRGLDGAEGSDVPLARKKTLDSVRAALVAFESEGRTMRDWQAEFDAVNVAIGDAARAAGVARNAYHETLRLRSVLEEQARLAGVCEWHHVPTCSCGGSK